MYLILMSLITHYTNKIFQADYEGPALMHHKGCAITNKYVLIETPLFTNLNYISSSYNRIIIRKTIVDVIHKAHYSKKTIGIDKRLII